MSHPRPDPPRLDRYQWHHEGMRGSDFSAPHPDDYVLWEDVAALLSDLRTLEAQWRKDSEIEPGMRDEDVEHADGVRDCADDLAALLARLEGQ
jgi:hypothetical protein